MSKKWTVAIYAVTRMGDKGVKKWFNSVKEADHLLILNASPYAKPLFAAKSLGIEVRDVLVQPFRYDIARNAAIALIPESFEICISLDLDEILSEDWRPEVEEAFSRGINMPRISEVNESSENDLEIAIKEVKRIHPRKGFFWQQPFNEELVAVPTIAVTSILCKVELRRSQSGQEFQQKPSRLETSKAIQQQEINELKDWHSIHKRMHASFNIQDWELVLQLSELLKKFDAPKALDHAAACLWASEAAHNLGLSDEALNWAKRATEIDPEFYEAWHWLAHILHFSEKWEEVLEFASKMIDLKKGNHRYVRESVWSWWGFDLMALASHKLKLSEQALKYGELALTNSPFDPRLARNLMIYRQANGGISKSVDQSSVESIEGLKP